MNPSVVRVHVTNELTDRTIVTSPPADLDRPLDFTASSILAPVGLTPVFVRLHNLAHYGQTAVLSAMMLAAFLAPVLAVALGGVVGRWYAGRARS